MAVKWSKYNKKVQERVRHDIDKDEYEEVREEKSLDAKIADFDASHIPVYQRAWSATKNPYRDNRALKSWQEKMTVTKIKTFPELSDEERTGLHPRVVLLTRPEDKVEDVMKKTVSDFAKDRQEAKEARDRGDRNAPPLGKEVPSLAVVSPNGEIEGNPVAVDKYLLATRQKSLEKAMEKDAEREPVFEAVYKEGKNRKLTHEASWLKEVREFGHKKEAVKEKETTRDQKDKKKEKPKEHNVNGKIVHSQLEADAERARVIRANGYLWDQDMAAEQVKPGGSSVRDTKPITNAKDLETQVRTQLETAKGNEQKRRADPMITPEKREDRDQDGIPDIFEYEDHNGNGIDDRDEADWLLDIDGDGVPDDPGYRDENNNGIDDRKENQDVYIEDEPTLQEQLDAIDDFFKDPNRERGDENWTWY